MNSSRPLIGALAVLLALSASARADVGAAAADFREGRRLARAGRYDEACPRFEASHRAVPALGTLLNLAICHEKVGRTASAHAGLRAAQEMARQRGDARESVARELADGLEPRLTRLRIVLAGPAPHGLVVRRGDTDVTAVLGTAMAVDPGDHAIAASAPGHQTWTATVSARGEGRTSEVLVPTLVALAAPAAAAPAPAPRKVLAIARPASPARSPWRRNVAFGLGGMALAAAGGAIALEESGLDYLARSEVTVDDDYQRALYDRANRDHILAQVVAGVSVGMLAASVYLLATDERSVDVTFDATGGRSGVSIQGRF